MTLAMGLLSLGGTVCVSARVGSDSRNAGTNWSAREFHAQRIDAGYVLNGEDLYRYPKHGIETMKLEGESR